jgi:hypothetical protein
MQLSLEFVKNITTSWSSLGRPINFRFSINYLFIPNVKEKEILKKVGVYGRKTLKIYLENIALED